MADACQTYQRATVQGQLASVRPGPLADFAVRHVRTGRHVGGAQERAQDVMSTSCQKRNGHRIDGYDGGRSTSGSEGWKQVAVAERKVPVPDTACFRIDFAGWLSTLDRRDCKIIAAMVEGSSTIEVAGRFGVTSGRVSQLRRKYERAWAAFHGELLSADGESR